MGRVTDTCTACGCPVTDWPAHTHWHNHLANFQVAVQDAVAGAYGMHLPSDQLQGTTAANAGSGT